MNAKKEWLHRAFLLSQNIIKGDEMGTYYLIANISRKEYLDPWMCDSGGKISEMAGTYSFQRIFTRVMLHNWLDSEKADKIALIPDYSDNFGKVKRDYKNITLENIIEYNYQPIESLFHLGNVETVGESKYMVDYMVLPPDTMPKERKIVIKGMEEFLSKCADDYYYNEMMAELDKCESWRIVQEIKKDFKRERVIRFLGCAPEEFFYQKME